MSDAVAVKIQEMSADPGVIYGKIINDTNFAYSASLLLSSLFQDEEYDDRLETCRNQMESHVSDEAEKDAIDEAKAIEEERKRSIDFLSRPLAYKVS